MLRILGYGLHTGLQLGQYPAPEIAQIGGAIANIGVFHHFKSLHVLEHHLAQGTLGPGTATDALDHLAGNRLIVEQHAVGIEQRQLFRAHPGAQLGADRGNLLAHPVHRPLEQRHLGGGVRALALRDAIEIRGWRDHHHAPDGDARRSRYPAKFRGPSAGIATRPAKRPGQTGVGDETGELRRHRDQEGFLVLVETAALALLHHQHAEYLAVVDDRHPEKGLEDLLARILDVFVVRMRFGIFEVERLLAPRHVANQSLVQGQAHLPLELLVQALGGHEHIAIVLRIMDVHRTHLGAHRIAHAPHDDLQGLRQIARGDHLLHDAAQRFQHGIDRRLFSSHCAPACRDVAPVPRAPDDRLPA